MPAWWKSKSKQKPKQSSPSSPSSNSRLHENLEEKTRKATSSDEAAVMARKGSGGSSGSSGGGPHPLPRPSSLSSPLPSEVAAAASSASASVSSSGSSSSTASEDAPDLRFFRYSDSTNTPRGRPVADNPQRPHGVVDDTHLFARSQYVEHPRLLETSVSPRKEFRLHSFDPSTAASTNSHGRRSLEITFNTRTPSSPPGSGGHLYPTSPVHPRALGQCPGSPTSWQDDNRSSPHPLPLPPGSPSLSAHSLQSQWKKGKLLGKGTFGHVYLGFNSEGGQMCAIKEVKVISEDANSKECLKQLNQEITLLSQLSHLNIVQYYGSELLDDTLSVYLEYVSGGSIYKLLQEYGPLRESVIRKYTAQLLSGLVYLHGRNTVHRDIKGANILVDPNGDIKLADFGMAKHISSYTSIKSFKGSPYWMAPEVIMNGNGYNLSVDIWSLGCTILEMATSKPPWSQYEGVAAIFKIGNSKDIPDIPDHLSAEAKKFLKLCLQRDPAARPTAAKLMDHPFVKDHAAIRGTRSTVTRDTFLTPSDGNHNMLQTNEFSTYRSISPLREADLRTSNFAGQTSALPSLHMNSSNLFNTRMNMSLPVSPSSSPLRQFRQSNRSCLPSPPHPAYSAGAANYSPLNDALYPLRPRSTYADPRLDMTQFTQQTWTESPKRL